MFDPLYTQVIDLTIRVLSLAIAHIQKLYRLTSVETVDSQAKRSDRTIDIQISDINMKKFIYSNLK